MSRINATRAQIAGTDKVLNTRQPAQTEKTVKKIQDKTDKSNKQTKILH